VGKRKSTPKLKLTDAKPIGTVGVQTDHRNRRKNWYVLLPCVAAFLAFLPILRFGFVGDDHAQIERNPQVQSWSCLPRLLTTDMWSQKGADHEGFFYRPLFSVWLLFFYSVAGASPWLWHLASILLHVTATFLVFKFIYKRLRHDVAASFAALVFAIHPIHIEAVSWVSAGNELFYTICILGSLILLLESKAGSWDNNARGALILWVLALFFKETAIVLLFVFILMCWMHLETPDDTGGRSRLKLTVMWALPWIVTAGIYIGLRTVVLQRSGLETGKQPWAVTLFSAPGLLVFYLKKLVFPWHLSSFYYESLTSSPGTQTWVEIAVILALISLFLWAAHKKNHLLALSGAIIIFPLLPILGGLRIYEHGNIAHDRYLYLPAVGTCLLVGILVHQLSAYSFRWKVLTGTVGAVVVSSGIYLCLSQQHWYVGDTAYYARAVELHPENYLAWEFWAQFDFSHKSPKEGLEKATQAYRLAPENVSVGYYYARGLFENERFVQAEPLPSVPTSLRQV
jgi:protein O-mannosyl-transferase